MEGCRIEAATSHDIATILELSSQVHLAQYEQFIDPSKIAVFKRRYRATPEQKKRQVASIAKRLNNNAYILLKAATESSIVGYISAEKNNTSIKVRGLFVSSAYQGRGVGSALFAHLIEQYGKQPMYLEVIAANNRAIHLYEEVGFIRGASVQGKSFYGAPLISMHRPGKTSLGDV